MRGVKVQFTFHVFSNSWSIKLYHYPLYPVYQNRNMYDKLRGIVLSELQLNITSKNIHSHHQTWCPGWWDTLECLLESVQTGCKSRANWVSVLSWWKWSILYRCAAALMHSLFSKNACDVTSSKLVPSCPARAWMSHRRLFVNKLDLPTISRTCTSFNCTA